MSIKINSRGEIIVSVPNKASDRVVLEFINKHSEWIQEKSSKINDVLKENAEIINYEKVFYLGKKYKVVYVSGLNQICLRDDELYVPQKFKKRIKEHLKEWYLTYFNEIVVNRANMLLDKLNIYCNEIIAVNSVRCWGSCSSDKKIRFNYKLLMLDNSLIDYVIVHEVCHLFEMNHSPRFWKKVSIILPNYKELINKLKNCGYLLTNL